MLQNYEVLAEPKVETLVHAANPEACAYTIDRITLPDFDAFMRTDVQLANVPYHYIVKPGEYGMSMTANIRPEHVGLQAEHEAMDSIKAWALKSIEALQIPLPEGGLPVKFFLFYLFGPVNKEQAETTAWHMDTDDGALTVFEVDPTEILDEVFQDAFIVDDDRELVIIEDTELIQHAGQPIDGHIRRPACLQTVFIGRRTIHRQPELVPGQTRKGVICFINSEL